MKELARAGTLHNYHNKTLRHDAYTILHNLCFYFSFYFYHYRDSSGTRSVCDFRHVSVAPLILGIEKASSPLVCS